MVSGTLTAVDRSAAITNGRLRGNEITFTLGDAQYQGIVRGTTIEGIVSAANGNRTWKATRSQ